jgi:hypothetical protein
MGAEQPQTKGQEEQSCRMGVKSQRILSQSPGNVLVPATRLRCVGGVQWRCFCGRRGPRSRRRARAVVLSVIHNLKADNPLPGPELLPSQASTCRRRVGAKLNSQNPTPLATSRSSSHFNVQQQAQAHAVRTLNECPAMAPH